MMENEMLIITRKEAVCTMIINNPDKHNIVTPDCLQKMADSFEKLSNDDTIRAVVIRGAGERAFSAGYDIGILPGKSESETPEKSPFEIAMETIYAYPYPVIAMLNGFAFGGGCELAVTCDIRIAGAHVRMGMPPAKIGLVYRYGGLRRFLTVLGYARTLELFLTARYYDSRQCREMGLINHVVEKNQLERFTYELAQEMTQNAPISLKETKFILNKIVQYPEVSEQDIALFKSLALKAFHSEDMAEGKRAFKEKRKPKFKGR